jgi:anti-sigma regulatory factor (Ser/Thr protein kinase)
VSPGQGGLAEAAAAGLAGAAGAGAAEAARAGTGAGAARLVPGRSSARSIRLDPVRASAAAARRWLRSLLDGVLPAEVVDDAILVASELIANSVEHTDSAQLTLAVHVDRRGLVVEVGDEGPGLPGAWPMPGFRGRSRGLMMIGKLTTSVVSRPVPGGGALVEAVLPIPPRTDPAEGTDG